MDCSLCLSNFPCNLMIIFNPEPLKFQDVVLTKALKKSLKGYGVFESKDELQHR